MAQSARAISVAWLNQRRFGCWGLGALSFGGEEQADAPTRGLQELPFRLSGALSSSRVPD